MAGATHDPNDFFVTEATFPGSPFADVHGTSATNLFAVGANGGSSFIATRLTSAWASQTVPNVGRLESVWVIDANNAYAGGGIGATSFLYWNGATWTAKPFPVGFTGAFVSAKTATNILFHGTKGDSSLEVLEYDGTSFGSPVTCTGASPLFWLSSWVGPTGNYWGTADVTYSYDEVANACESFPSLTSLTLLRDTWDPIGGSTLATNWRVGSGGVVVKGDLPEMSSTMNDLYSIHGVSVTDKWAVGVGGTIIHSASASGGWTLEPTTTSELNSGVYFADANNGWIVDLAGAIQKLGVNNPIAYPSLAGFMWDPDNMHLSASQAQCLGDGVSLAVDIQPPTTTGLLGYVSRTSDGTVIETLPQTSWTINAGGHFAQDRVYPAGDYELLVTTDYLLGQDNFGSWAFNVPVGTCLDSNQDGHDDHMSEEHFDQDLLHPGGGGSGGLIPLSNFPGIPLDDSTGIFLLFVLMLWALTESLFFLGAASLMGIMATWLGSLDPGGEWDGGTGFAVALGLVILAVWVEAIVRAARNSTRAP